MATNEQAHTLRKDHIISIPSNGNVVIVEEPNTRDGLVRLKVEPVYGGPSMKLARRPHEWVTVEGTMEVDTDEPEATLVSEPTGRRKAVKASPGVLDR